MPRKQPTTLAECNAELELAQKQLRQYQNREKVLTRKLFVEERRIRTHRLCARGGYLESIVPELIAMTDEEAKDYLYHAVHSEEAKMLLLPRCVLPLPRSTQRGSKSIFEKTSRGRGYGIIPLFTRAHLYTLSGVVRSAEGFVGAWEIHTPTLAACAAQGKLHFPCDSLRCLPFSALAESEHLASQAIHFPQV